MKLDPLHFRGSAGLLHHAHAFLGGGSSAAPQRNLTQELEQTLAGEQNTAAGFFNLNADPNSGQPAYDRLGLQEQQLQQQGYFDAAGTYHPGTTALGQAANTSNRGAALTDLLGYGPAGTAGILQANPFLEDALTLQDNAAFKAANPSSLLQQLQQQASSQLASNGELSDAEKRDLSQQTLAGFAANGTNNGNQSLGADLLSRSAAVTQRQQQAQQFAGSVEGLGQQQQSLAGSLAGNAANTASASLTNPLLQMLGLANLNPGYSGSGASGSSSAAGSSNLFPQFNSYLQDLYSSNQNAAAYNNATTANNNTALLTSGIGLVGSLFSDERLKKKVKTVGKTPSGIPEKEWTYKTDPHGRRWHGAMAQDIEKVFPDAVETDPISGLKAVRYDKTDVPFGLVEELLAAA